MSRRVVAALLIALPLAELAAAFVWLAAAHGGWDLRGVAVHEDGQRTLAATMLYWRHFLREVPVLCVVVAGLTGAYATYGPRSRRRVPRHWPVWLAVLLVVIAFAAAASEAGPTIAAWDFAQAYTRDDRWEYGSHWRDHLLATLGIAAAAVVAATLLARQLDGTWPLPRRAARRQWLGGALLAYAGLTWLCEPSWAPFTDARCVGHQLRELVTHVAITLPLGLGVLLGLTSPLATTEPPRPLGWPRDARLALLVLFAVGLFLGSAALGLGAAAAARPGAGLAALVAAHAFEHTLDYVFVALLCGWLATRTAFDNARAG
ncbi:MAG: hypothetical protein ABI629_09505 [bacterium]